MLQDFFISMFEFLHGNQSSVFRDRVYDPAGEWLLVLTLLIVLIYYYGINVVRARFAKRSFWLTAAAVNTLLCIVSAMAVVHRAEGLALFEAASVSFYFIDALYAVIVFLVLSVLLKWWSPNARRTPF